MRKDYRFQIDITLLSPVISQAQQGTQLGIDTEAWQLQKDGKNYAALPGTLIRGNLLQSWLSLETLPKDWITKKEIEEYLGQKALKTNTDNNVPQRAQLRSSDNWVAKQETQAATLHRIKIDKASGVVGAGMLQTLTAPHPVGREVVYSGWFEVTAEESQLEDLKHKLEKGLAYIPALGAFKGVGFGRVLNIQVSDAIKCENDDELVNTEIADEQFSLQLNLDRPICFARPHPEMSNRFESSLKIPGGAIKGGIATRIKQLDDPELEVLADNLAFIQISHAYPCLAKKNNKKRATAVPLSLYLAQKNDKDSCFDASHETQQTTIKRQNIRFKVDWKGKDYNLITPFFSGMTDEELPQRVLRVRTAIESDTQASKDKALFSIDAVETDKHVWISNINLLSVQEEKREAVKYALKKLLSQGLNSLGKTRAQSKKIKIHKPLRSILKHQQLEILAKGDKITILLQSDTLLFEQNIIENSTAIPASGGGKALQEIYAKSWDTLSEKSLQLNNYFAQQSLYGGDYYWRRFSSPDQTYNPLLLTKAGSLFVLEVINTDKALEKLKLWQKHGITFSVEGKNDWQTNPLLANNGYGEVLINPQISSLLTRLNQKQKEEEKS